MSKSRINNSPDINSLIICVLCACIPILIHTGVYQFALLPKRLILQIGLCLVAIIWWRNTKSQSPRPTHVLLLPLLCHFGLSLLAITQSTNTTDAVVETAHQLTFILLFILVFHSFQLSKFLLLLRICAGVGIFVSIIGILEARGFDATWIPLSNGRPSATFAYRNFAAAYLIMCIPLTTLLALINKKKQDFPLGIIATTLMFSFLVYTRTRGAWAGLFCACLITTLIAIFAKSRWKTPTINLTHLTQNATNKIICASALVIFTGLASLPPQIASQHSRAIDEKKVALTDALTISTPQADRGRRTLWANTLKIIADHPLLGVGPANWKYMYPLYDQGDMIGANSAPERPHNAFLQIASERGIPACLTFVWFLLTIAYVVIQILKNAKDPSHIFYTLAISASMLAMLGHSQVSFPQERIETNFLFWIGLAILAQIYTQVKTQESSNYFIPQWATPLLPALSILLLCLTYFQIRFDRHYLRAAEYHKGNQYQAVIIEANQALNWGVFNAQIYLLQGNGYRYTNQPQHAQVAYQKGLQYHPNSIQLYKALGTAYALQQNFTQAEKAYHQALKLYPNYTEAYNDLGNIYQQQENFASAIAAYKKAAPESNTTTQRNLAIAYTQVDSNAQAIRLYRNLIESDPNDLALFYELGEAYLNYAPQDPKAYIQARAAFNHFVKYWPNNDQYKQTAQSHLNTIQKHLAQTP